MKIGNNDSEILKVIGSLQWNLYNMKRIIYITGVAGGVLLILRLVGIFAGFSFNDQILVYGLVLLVVCITLTVTDRHIQRQKIRILLRYYKEAEPVGRLQDGTLEKAHEEPVEKTQGEPPQEGQDASSAGERPDEADEGKKGVEEKRRSGERGLEPGKTSLRQRKAGLVWGGGNIKGATAARGTKRRFLKR